jgi:hypothetical protein
MAGGAAEGCSVWQVLVGTVLAWGSGAWGGQRAGGKVAGMMLRGVAWPAQEAPSPRCCWGGLL